MATTLAETLADQLNVKAPEQEKTNDKKEDTTPTTPTTEIVDKDKDKDVSETEKKNSDGKADDEKPKPEDDKADKKEPKSDDTKSKTTDDGSVDFTADDDPDDESSPEEKIAFWKKHSRMWERKARGAIRESEGLRRKVEDPSVKQELDELRDFKNKTLLSQEKVKLAEKEGVPVEVVNALPGNIDEVKTALKALKSVGAVGATKEAQQQQKRPVPTFGKQTEKPSSLRDILAEQLDL